MAWRSARTLESRSFRISPPSRSRATKSGISWPADGWSGSSRIVSSSCAPRAPSRSCCASQRNLSRSRWSRSFQPGEPAAGRSDLEPHTEPRPDAIVDQLEPVVVLMAVLMLKEVRKVVADLQLHAIQPPVGEGDVGVCMALLQIHGAAFVAEAVDLRQAAARDAKS